MALVQMKSPGGAAIFQAGRGEGRRMSAAGCKQVVCGCDCEGERQQGVKVWSQILVSRGAGMHRGMVPLASSAAEVRGQRDRGHRHEHSSGDEGGVVGSTVALTCWIPIGDWNSE